MDILGKKALVSLSYYDININICFAQQYLISFVVVKAT